LGSLRALHGGFGRPAKARGSVPSASLAARAQGSIASTTVFVAGGGFAQLHHLRASGIQRRAQGLRRQRSGIQCLAEITPVRPYSGPMAPPIFLAIASPIA
jgi:hypothetical protein